MQILKHLYPICDFKTVLLLCNPLLETIKVQKRKNFYEFDLKNLLFVITLCLFVYELNLLAATFISDLLATVTNDLGAIG